jgi:hypothetical protein
MPRISAKSENSKITELEKLQMKSLKAKWKPYKELAKKF